MYKGGSDDLKQKWSNTFPYFEEGEKLFKKKFVFIFFVKHIVSCTKFYS